jgi:hypothetical protein
MNTWGSKQEHLRHQLLHRRRVLDLLTRFMGRVVTRRGWQCRAAFVTWHQLSVGQAFTHKGEPWPIRWSGRLTRTIAYGNNSNSNSNAPASDEATDGGDGHTGNGSIDSVGNKAAQHSATATATATATASTRNTRGGYGSGLVVGGDIFVATRDDVGAYGFGGNGHAYTTHSSSRARIGGGTPPSRARVRVRESVLSQQVAGTQRVTGGSPGYWIWSKRNTMPVPPVGAQFAHAPRAGKSNVTAARLSVRVPRGGASSAGYALTPTALLDRALFAPTPAFVPTEKEELSEEHALAHAYVHPTPHQKLEPQQRQYRAQLHTTPAPALQSKTIQAASTLPVGCISRTKITAPLTTEERVRMHILRATTAKAKVAIV